MDLMSLTDLAEEHLEVARASTAGRSSITITGGREFSLRQNLMVLLQGRTLSEHESPSEATLHVMRGSVRVASATGSWVLDAGDYVVIPHERHDVEALADTVMLLTVSKEFRHEPAA